MKYYRILLVIIFLFASLNQTIQAADQAATNYSANQLFKEVWDKADGPIVASKANRSWLWGPGPFFTAREEYDEGLAANRYVMYVDKARLELTDPTKTSVTNGLLVIEMIAGKLQYGDNRYAETSASELNMIGDPGNWLTYSKLRPYATVNDDNKATNRLGQTIDQELTLDGVITSTRAGQQPITFFEPTLGHNVPKVFWDYLNQIGTVYSRATGAFNQAQPINWLSDAGYPISEAYWVKQTVGGVEKEVMIQAFQRRTLTYTPANPAAYQIEMGNVGRHYVTWRYSRNFQAGINWPAGGIDLPPAPFELSGTTNLTSTRITLAKGIARFDLAYEGQENFIVRLLTEAGQSVELVANEIGNHVGTKLIVVPQSGSYVIDVRAIGNWRVSIEGMNFLRAQPITPVARPYSGTNDTTFKINITKTGETNFKLEHLGPRNFIVTLYDQNGTIVDLLANEIGNFNGDKKVSTKPGDYYISVEAEGKWSLDVGL